MVAMLGLLRRIVGVLGELLVTAGLVLLLYIAYELWWSNIGADREQESAVAGLAREFDTADSHDGPENGNGNPPVARLATGGSTFAIMYVPRFGDDYARPITDGVGKNVLDNFGIGHYPQTQMPGERGNFAVAAHRQTHGAVFWNIDKLRDGDEIYIQTREGFYTYRYKDTEIVQPSASEVLLPVPHKPGAVAGESLLTMTSCDPPFTTEMRIVAYAELTSFQSAQSGPPERIRHAVQSALEASK